MSEISVQEAYQVMQEHCGIEVGDTVKVLRAPKEKYELGSSALIDSTDEKFVGGTFPVSRINAREIKLEGLGHTTWGFPFFCLELVEKAKLEIPNEVSFGKDGITVKGTFVSKDTIKRNLDL